MIRLLFIRFLSLGLWAVARSGGGGCLHREGDRRRRGAWARRQGRTEGAWPLGALGPSAGRGGRSTVRATAAAVGPGVVGGAGGGMAMGTGRGEIEY